MRPSGPCIRVYQRPRPSCGKRAAARRSIASVPPQYSWLPRTASAGIPAARTGASTASSRRQSDCDGEGRRVRRLPAATYPVPAPDEPAGGEDVAHVPFRGAHRPAVQRRAHLHLVGADARSEPQPPEVERRPAGDPERAQRACGRHGSAAEIDDFLAAVERLETDVEEGREEVRGPEERAQAHRRAPVARRRFPGMIDRGLHHDAPGAVQVDLQGPARRRLGGGRRRVQRGRRRRRRGRRRLWRGKWRGRGFRRRRRHLLRLRRRGRQRDAGREDGARVGHGREPHGSRSRGNTPSVWKRWNTMPGRSLRMPLGLASFKKRST